jgi:hypothetical protein
MKNHVAMAVMQINALDDSTDGEIVLTAEADGFEISQGRATEQLDLAQAERWLNRYWKILLETLNRLCNQRGRPESVSLKLLVEGLCKLYEYETGGLVTAHAMKGDDYASRVETDAGRFVTLAVEAMLPDQSWFEQHVAQSIRAESFLPGRQKTRAVQLIAITRDFVARRNEPLTRPIVRHLTNMPSD